MILCADVGGTKTLLGLFDAQGGAWQAIVQQRYLARDWPSFDALLDDFLRQHQSLIQVRPIRAACLGVAGPVDAGVVRMTNLNWTLDSARLKQTLGPIPIRLVNDFEAAASGIDSLSPQDLFELQPGRPTPGGNQLVIGAGTGLGVAWRVWRQGRYEVLTGEGGHVGYSPINEVQARCMARMRGVVDRVVAEHVVSGPGLVHLYRALDEGAPFSMSLDDSGLSAQEVVRRAREQSEPRALSAVKEFFLSYGAIAASHALTLLARGGVFVAGGMVTRLMEPVKDGAFLAGFHRTGPYSALLESMPVHVVTHPDLGLLGAAVIARGLLD
ncbi:MAG: glucokinase [Burkholderiales bacterium]|nr:glucokinase [Burkholderiales bacterium]MDE2075836.1 glucokinase [Burkholderiales bacterium]